MHYLKTLRKKVLTIEKITYLLTLIASWFIFLIGEWHISLTVLFVFLVFGGVTAFFKATLTRTINSNNAYKVMIKKVGIIMGVMIANLLDMMTGYDLLFRSVTILIFVGLIGLEIIENLTIMGVPMPYTITKYLSNLSEEGKDNK